MTYAKQDIDAPLHYVKGLLAQLHVEPTLLEVIDKEVEETRFTADALRREWINDVLSRPPEDPVRAAALEKPDIQFYRYVEKRAADPLSPAPRLVRTLVDEFGVEVVAPIREHTWHRQIDWARRLQMHPDDEFVLLAKFFLREATGEHCDQAFEGLIRFQREQCDPAAYEIMVAHDHTGEDIATLKIDDLETFPTCIEYMRSKRAAKIATMTPKMRSDVAAGIRRQSQIEAQSDRIARLKESYAKRPVYFSSLIAVEAVIMGLSSDDILSVNDDFIASLETQGPPDGDTGTAESRFLALMNRYTREQRTVPEISPAQRNDRMDRILSIGPGWAKKLGAIHADVDGLNPSNWNRWLRTIHHGERTPPRDWSLDYYLFLLKIVRG
ncbi:hypothetical protein [Salipiger mucosus]|uniref:Uncharacterized protein n=1 Tax=Salipiger mucosus DSM 16094 TaxID=1123237 RepID=S9QQ72_9RHOB|nr:hypothetical protein [Salipiger mucosus]EPX83546.1 hypothetical protein Salmuc_02154 [Salipiger mucosus DSM 16094]